jgi:NADPH:quinone reductase-like Zn-dependent oxidoreductase
MVKAFGYQRNGGPDVQEFLDLEMPTPMPGELLVEVRSAGVNPVDWKIRSGMLGEAAASDLPAVLGSEVSGVVREVGKDVEGFAVNDEVFGSVATGSGGYTEYTLVPANAAAAKPEGRPDAPHQRYRRRCGSRCCSNRKGLRHQRHWDRE